MTVSLRRWSAAPQLRDRRAERPQSAAAATVGEVVVANAAAAANCAAPASQFCKVFQPEIGEGPSSSHPPETP